jgi:DNA-binding transcriptional LysR family regulator
MDRGNRLALRPLDLSDYTNGQHVGTVYGRGWVSSYLQALHAMGIEITPAITVPNPLGVEDLIEGTDLIATVPKRFAQTVSSSLHVASCPVPAPFDVDLIWTLRTHTASAHRWFRNMIAQAVKTGLHPGA